ncbi:MAG: hypothetical protein MZW92_14600 [Comamonadaceae bacterium]|nr:hypothetical protein [Comamonadaceae bacterium]
MASGVRRPAFGVRRSAFEHRRRRRPPGRAPAFMSPGAGLRPSPPPRLHSGTRPVDRLLHRCLHATGGAPGPCAPRTSGGRIAEVKEEARRSRAGGHGARPAARRPRSAAAAARLAQHTGARHAASARRSLGAGLAGPDATASESGRRAAVARRGVRTPGAPPAAQPRDRLRVEHRDRLGQRGGLLAQTVGGGGALLDERGVLLRHLVELRDRAG